MVRQSFVWASLLVICLLAGCSERVATVSGVVKVDGVPLEKGAISFVAAEGAGSSATADVRSGAYRVQMPAGKKIVQLTAPRVTGRRKEYNGPTAPEVDITEESLAEKYNAKSELTFEATSGSSEKNWDVESIPLKGKR